MKDLFHLGILSFWFIVFSSDPWNPYPIRGDVLLNVRDFGAIGDNSTVDTHAIQNAIDACARKLKENLSPIGYIIVPKGNYLIGTINLTSNVYMILDQGAVLQGSEKPEHYAYDWQQWNVVQGRNISNSGIIGLDDESIGGELRGSMWKMLKGWDSVNNNLIPKSWSGVNGCDADCRPMNLAFVDSTNITVANIRITHSAFWTQLFRRCKNVVERNVDVFGATQYPNNDGLDIESCENITIVDSNFVTGDDCIAMRSGNCQALNHPWPLDPFGKIQPTRSIRLDNLTLQSSGSAIKIEALFQLDHGNLSDIEVSNVNIVKSNRGIGIWQRNGNGTLGGIRFRDISIETEIKSMINFWGSGEPIVISSIPMGEEPETIGLKGIRNVSFHNVVAKSEGGILLGTFSKLQNVTTPGQGSISDVIFHNMDLTIGVYGNSSIQYGHFHDYSPSGKYRAPVDGIFIDGKCDVQFDSVNIKFAGTSSNWTMQCFNVTSRSPYPILHEIVCQNETFHS